MPAQRRAQPLEIARTKRDRPSPCNAVSRIREPDESLAAIQFE